MDTVERFQGQQRDVMLATFALGDPDAIRDEDEFFMSLNRFNVMASRTRVKLVVLVSQEVVRRPKERTRRAALEIGSGSGLRMADPHSLVSTPHPSS